MFPELDRPILAALRSRQAEFATGSARALRYASDVSPFAAAVDDSVQSLEELASLIPAKQSLVLLQAGDAPLPDGTSADMVAEGVQMVAQHLAPIPADKAFAELGDVDAPEMLALATLTKPGPFLPRTHRLGHFIGIREQGLLVAMAGERMKLPGLTEVSGVCTHPEYRGKGFAGLLTLAVSTRILARGETPFLHAFASNSGAIRLYEALGFVRRRMMTVKVLRSTS